MRTEQVFLIFDKILVFTQQPFEITFNSDILLPCRAAVDFRRYKPD